MIDGSDSSNRNFAAQSVARSFPAACAQLPQVDYSSVSNWPGDWYFAQVNTQRIQHASDLIENSGVPVYIPRETRERIYAGIKRKISQPCFRGYLFFCLHDESLLPYSPKRDWGIYTYKRPANQPLIRRTLNELQLRLADGRFKSDRELHSGQRVEVARGAFRGSVGTIQSVGRTVKIIVQSLAAQLEIDPSAVDVIE